MSLRNCRMYVCSVVSALRGEFIPHNSSISDGTVTTWLACSASSARICLGLLALGVTDRPFSYASSGPRTLTSICPPSSCRTAHRPSQTTAVPGSARVMKSVMNNGRPRS